MSPLSSQGFQQGSHIQEPSGKPVSFWQLFFFFFILFHTTDLFFVKANELIYEAETDLETEKTRELKGKGDGQRIN